MIRQHLLPLTKENANEQYALVQPIRIFFAERCICYLLTINWVVGLINVAERRYLQPSDNKLVVGLIEVAEGCFFRTVRTIKTIRPLRGRVSRCCFGRWLFAATLLIILVSHCRV